MNKKEIKSFYINYESFKIIQARAKLVTVTNDQFNQISQVKGKGIHNVTGHFNDEIVTITRQKNEDSNATTYYIAKGLTLLSIFRDYFYDHIDEQDNYEIFKQFFSKIYLRNGTDQYYEIVYNEGHEGLSPQEIIKLEGPVVCHPNKAVYNVTKEINSKYTKTEIKDLIKAHQSLPYSPSHYTDFFYEKTNEIQKVEGCYYYDINKAYSSRLAKVFNKTQGYFEDLIKIGKADPNKKQWSKDIPNYAIGCFQTPKEGDSKYKKYWPSITNEQLAGFRYWVVKDIDEQVNIAIYSNHGQLIYLNTDGYIIKDPLNKIQGSSKLGQFKEEPIDNHTIWTFHYMDPNDYYDTYTCMQWFENGKKVVKSIGNSPVNSKEFFDLIDLSQNKYPVFKTKIEAGHKIITEIKVGN